MSHSRPLLHTDRVIQRRHGYYYPLTFPQLLPFDKSVPNLFYLNNGSRQHSAHIDERNRKVRSWHSNERQRHNRIVTNTTVYSS